MEKRYMGRVEMSNENATVTVWEINPNEENNHLVTVWDIVGSPGWTWGFSSDGSEVKNVISGDTGYQEIYKHCAILQNGKTVEDLNWEEM